MLHNKWSDSKNTDVFFGEKNEITRKSKHFWSYFFSLSYSSLFMYVHVPSEGLDKWAILPSTDVLYR